MKQLDDDTALMLRVRDEDDRDAFEALVRKYQGVAVGTAYRFLGDASTAQDIAQEAFLNLYRSRRRYRPTAAFRTFFYRIIANLCYSALRGARPALPLDAVTHGDQPGLGDTVQDERMPAPDASLQRLELIAAVRSAIDTLPPKQRMALVLFRFQGLSYAGTAAIMGTSEKAVKSLLARARAALRGKLARHL